MTTNVQLRAELAFQAIAAVECESCGEAIQLDVSRKGEVERCGSCGERYCLACGESEDGDCDCIPRCGECGRWVELPPLELSPSTRVRFVLQCPKCGMNLCNLCGAVPFCQAHDLNTEDGWVEGGDHAFLADPPRLSKTPARAISKRALRKFFGDLAPIVDTYSGSLDEWPNMHSYASAIFQVARVLVIEVEWASAPGVSGSHYLAENADETRAAIRAVEKRFQARFREFAQWLGELEGETNA